MSELFRKIEEAARLGKKKGRSGRLVPNRSELFPPRPNPLPPSDKRWDEGLEGIRQIKAALASGKKEFSALSDTEKAVWRHYFSRELTALLKGMKQFQSYAKTPEEERHGLLKTAIGAAGLAAGLTGAGHALKGTVAAAERADIARNAVNRVVRAQRNAKAAAMGVAAEKAKGAKTAAKARYKAGNASFKKAASNPNLSKGEKAAFKRAQTRWQEANPNNEFETVIVQNQKRDALSKIRDAASLAASVGSLGLLGYVGYRGHGLYKKVSKEIPKVAATFHEHAPAVAAHAKETMSKVSSAADAIKATAASVKNGPIADGAPNVLKRDKKAFSDERKHSVLLPLIGGAAIGAGAVAIPQVARAARRVEKVAKTNLRKAGNVAESVGRTQDNVKHSTSIYADLGRIYGEAKGGIYNILHPINTWKETKAGFKAGMKGKKSYATRPRPDWALSAKLKIKELAEDFRRYEDGVPFNGRVAHDRFIKTIHEGDLDRRDRNIVHAAVAGGLAGALVRGRKPVLNKVAIGAALGAGGVIAVRGATNHSRDIYGDRPRWAKQAENIPALAGTAAIAGLAAKRAKLFARKNMVRALANPHFFEKQSNPTIKAAILGGSTGAILGAIPGLKMKSTLAGTLTSIGRGAALGGSLAGGGTAIGTAILGKPKNHEGAPVTKRAALGGAIVGGILGGTGVVAARKFPASVKWTGINLDKLANPKTGWRPAAFMKKAPLPLAAAAGAGAGAVVGGSHAADEGQEVDTVNSLQGKKKFFEEFRGYSPYDDVADARKQAFHASGVTAAVGMAAAAGLGYRGGSKAQFARTASRVKKSFKETKTAKASARAWRFASQQDSQRASRAEAQARDWENKYRNASSSSKGASNSSRQGPPPRHRAKGPTNPHAGTAKAEKWEKWQSMKRTASESNHEGERTAAQAAADKWQKKYNLARKIKTTLKEFGFYNQPRRAGEQVGTDKNNNPRYSRERGTFASPVRSAYGVEGDLLSNQDGTMPTFGQAQMIRGFYNEGKGIHKWGTRAARLAGDTGDVFAGNPRKRDASGRPQKREWEKSWFKNAAGAAAAGGALAGGAFVTNNTAWGRKNIQGRLKKIIRSAAKRGYRIFSSKVKPHFFDEWAAYNGWDVRDPRGRSARVFAPGSRARYRREKEWHEKKENRDLLWKVTAGTAGIGGAAVGILAARKHAGLPVNPFRTGGAKGVFDMKGNPVSAKAGPRYRSSVFPPGHPEEAKESIRKNGFHVVK
jgi:hypothetical protein